MEDLIEFRTFVAILILKCITMPRQSRKNSGTGIYHVMLRGINRQNIFEDSDDYFKFIKLLHHATHPTDERGLSLPPTCLIYAYCLMPNHVHLLIRETQENIGSVMKPIAVSYAIYYNKRYQRIGHLFQDRFKSEPVDDMEYFITLIRYIHQNPVAAGIVSHVDDYTWSSWAEYTESRPCLFPVCTVSHVLERVSRADLIELVNTPLAKTVAVLEHDTQSIKTGMSDEEVIEYLKTRHGINAATEIAYLNKGIQSDVIKDLRHQGAGLRQLVRLTGISYGILRKLKGGLKGDGSL